MTILGAQIEEMADRKGVEMTDNKTLLQEMEEDTERILEDDGYHNTNTAGEIIANEIENSIENRGKNTRKGNTTAQRNKHTQQKEGKCT